METCSLGVVTLHKRGFMTEKRLEEIYRSVVVNAFYSVGREQFLDSDITHDEMAELVKMACAGKPFAERTP
jgi:hypothetical protein